MRNLALTSHNAIYTETHRLDLLADAERARAIALCLEHRRPGRSPLAMLRRAMETWRMPSGRRVGGVAQPVAPATR